jgi:Ca-activated chloride channel family protein
MAMPAILRTMFDHNEPTLTPASASSGGALVCPDGRALPLRQTSLRSRARGGLARTVVRQTFVNPYDEALEVTYKLPLPVDGAVSGFRFELDGAVVVGEVDRKHRARERYEQAIVEGRTAALLEQERADLFTQRVGNIPPRSTLVAEVTVDQRLAWLDEGAWEWRFPSVVGPRYLGAEGRVPDADRVRVEVADRALPHRMAVELTVADAIVGGYKPASTSHALEVTRGDDGVTATFRDREGEPLDRDVVVRWPVATPEAGLSLDVARAPDGASDAGARYGLLTIVPPEASAKARALPRDLIFLIDTSGSMGGRPLEQAARVASAMIDTLTPDDRIEVIEFASSPRRWMPTAVAATYTNRREAIAWVRALRAGGSTEMRAALLDALRPLRDGAQRQVVLITDGYIGFEREIIETVYARLPRDCRLHTLGVGSSVNRALTGPAAQAGRGLEVVLGLDEDAERAARRMVDRTHAPLVTELTIDGDGVAEASPARLPDLFAASPVLASLRLGRPGTTVRVRGRTARGDWEQTLRVPAEASVDGGAARARFARDRVEDHELHLAAGGFAREIDGEIEALGVTFQIATRLTSWVAISRARTVGDDVPRRSEAQPHEAVYGASVEGMGLRAAAPPFATGAFRAQPLGSAYMGGSYQGGMSMQGAPALGAPPPRSTPAPQGPPSMTPRRAKQSAPEAPEESLASLSISRDAAPSLDAPRATRSRAPLRGWLLALIALLVMAVVGWAVYRALEASRTPPAATRMTVARPPSR